MKLKSSAFQEKGIIPSRYTHEGKEVSPPLEILNVPEKAKSLVLICDDPDVPKNIRPDGIYDHWVVFNIAPHTQRIEEGVKGLGVEGINTSGKLGYFGPNPPDREHRYFFKLYALDTMLALKVGSTKAEVEKAMQNHILAKAELMGRYENGKGY